MDGNQPVTDNRRQKQLLSLLDLLRYAEAEIAELNLETSAVLLRATIAELAQNVEQVHPASATL